MSLAGDTSVNKAGLLSHLLEFMAHQAGARGCCASDGTGGPFAFSVFILNLWPCSGLQTRTGLWTGLIGSPVPASVDEHTRWVVWRLTAFYFFSSEALLLWPLFLGKLDLASSREFYVASGEFGMRKNLFSQRPPPPWLICKPCGSLRRRSDFCSHPRLCSNGQVPKKANAVNAKRNLLFKG